MLNIVVGHSCDPDSQSAIKEVLEQCLDSLAGKVPNAGILFAAIHFDHASILQQIQQCFFGIELIGGTTDGELSSVLGFQEDSLTLMLFSSSTIEIRAGVGRGVAQDPTAAAQQAITQAKADLTQAPKLCIALSESLTTRAEGVLQGLKQTLGLHVPIMGGLTADQYRFQQTFQFFQTEVLSDAAPVLLFAGDLLVSCGVSSGSRPVGKKGRVTRVDKNIVYEIDGQSAYDFYRYKPNPCKKHLFLVGATEVIALHKESLFVSCLFLLPFPSALCHLPSAFFRAIHPKSGWGRQLIPCADKSLFAQSWGKLSRVYSSKAAW